MLQILPTFLKFIKNHGDIPHIGWESVGSKGLSDYYLSILYRYTGAVICLGQLSDSDNGCGA